MLQPLLFRSSSCSNSHSGLTDFEHVNDCLILVLLQLYKVVDVQQILTFCDADKISSSQKVKKEIYS